MSPERAARKAVDNSRVAQSMARLMDIYRDISDTAERVSRTRCPYKDARARCTGKFPCRNQFFKNEGEPAICTGSDDLDYREAWQM
ncbi:MAG: hypothetical protein V3S18_01620 [Dehalococcoidia bacterium]|jgi:hypothetical protein